MIGQILSMERNWSHFAVSNAKAKSQLDDWLQQKRGSAKGISISRLEISMGCLNIRQGFR